MTALNFESFREQKLSEGYDQVLVRNWEPNHANDAHTHPFDTDALVVEGEFALTVDGKTTVYRAGDRFSLAREVVHAEKYGPQGATFWAARKERLLSKQR